MSYADQITKPVGGKNFLAYRNNTVNSLDPMEHDYRPDIDGLRAVAILAVVLFHFEVAPFQGGFVGVDIFFVISGFLITRLIYRDISLGVFRFGSFYARRIGRILPALVFMIIAVTAVSLVILTPPELKYFGRGLIGVSLFVSNFVARAFSP